jgi:hypothetical protein
MDEEIVIRRMFELMSPEDRDKARRAYVDYCDGIAAVLNNIEPIIRELGFAPGQSCRTIVAAATIKMLSDMMARGIAVAEADAAEGGALGSQGGAGPTSGPQPE